MSAQLSTSQAAIIAEARKWCGTPYQHQASCRGVGADCLGLVRGIYSALMPDAALAVPPYTRFAAPGDGEDLWQAAGLYLIPQKLLPPFEAAAFAPGDIVLFRLRPRLPARHLAIISAPDKMVHALSHIGVCEVAFTPWWRRHAVARFILPARSPLALPPAESPRA